MRMHKALAAAALVAGTVAVNSCGIIGTVDFEVLFRPTGAPCAATCDAAGVSSIKFTFFDQALDNLVRTEVQRQCVPGERYKVSIDLGPYNIRTQGLNGALTVCYETNQLIQVQGGKTDQFTIRADQHAMGAAGGCTYPQVAPGPNCR